jgi:peroxiredoxin
MPLKPGETAPAFDLQAVAGDERIVIRSRDYLGKQNLVITFHPLDWTPT